MDEVKEDMQRVGITEENARDRVRLRQMIHSLKGTKEVYYN